MHCLREPGSFRWHLRESRRLRHPAIRSPTAARSPWPRRMVCGGGGGGALFARLLQVVDGSFHYAPEAMTLFDYRRELGPCLLLFAPDLTNRYLTYSGIAARYGPPPFRSSCNLSGLGRCRWLLSSLAFLQEWESRAEKEPTFMYVMPLGPVRALRSGPDRNSSTLLSAR